MSIVSIFPRKTKARQKKTDLQKKIDQFCGPVYGNKSAKGCPRNLKNTTYCRKYNEKGWVFLNSFKPTVAAYNTPNLKVCASLDTLKTVLYLDLDTHTTGKTEDVYELMRRVRVHFPNMPDAVVGPRGGSAWLIIDTHVPCGDGKTRAAASSAEYNDTVRKFQTWLQNLGADLDIEHIEVKGKVYEHNFDNHGKMLSVKAGDLLKVPPSEEWLTQPSITYADLKKLVDTLCPSVATLPSDRGCPSGNPGNLSLQASGVDTKQASTLTTPVVNPPSPPTPQANKLKSKKTGGSFSARILPDTQVDNLDLLVAEIDRLLPNRPQKTGRYAMTDRATTEMLTALCVLPPNNDGTAPYRRVAAFINSMEDAGVFKTRFQYERFKAMRDYLDANSLMDWIDPTYCYDPSGRRATAWKVSEDLKNKVLAILSGNTTQHTHPLIRTRILTQPVCVSSSGEVVKKSYEKLRLEGQKRQKAIHLVLFGEVDEKVRLVA